MRSASVSCLPGSACCATAGGRGASFVDVMAFFLPRDGRTPVQPR
jgi:hypothetical protein